MEFADKKLELLAPAGSFAALYAAVENGADAVYLGAKDFSARKSASNFSEEELAEAVIYCHERGVLAYLAVNTLIYENELQKLERIIRHACDIGIDGVIVQDMGVASFIKAVSPGMPLHASTQMTIHSAGGALKLLESGFRRVVLAREMSAEEIAGVCKSVNIETEVFVHGALCFSYSGRCLMSSMIGGRSGNRGSCAQPCRLPYTAGGKQGYYLSPRDLCLVHDISALRAAGVRSLKIEGRMKSPEYVAVVTNVYRKAIENRVTDDDVRRLEEIFCRGGGFTRGYFGGETGRPMMNISDSNDNLSAAVPKRLLMEARDSFKDKKRKLPVSISFIYSGDEPPALVFSGGGQKAKTLGATSDTPPLLKERISEQLSKLGNTPFSQKSITVSGPCPIKISELNRMRREAAEALRVKLLEKAKKQFVPYMDTEQSEKVRQREFDFSAHVQNLDQAVAAIDSGINRIYIPLYLCSDDILKFTDKAEVYAALPAIIKDGERQRVLSEIEQAAKSGAKGLLCDSLDALQVSEGLGLNVTGGMGLNITNSLSLMYYKGLGINGTALSPELSKGRIKALSNKGILELEAVIYGRLPLMVTENCITKISGNKCTCKSSLTDRMGAVFPVLKYQNTCRSVILNSRPLYMGDRLSEISSLLSWGQIYFTVESPAECRDIIEKYRKGMPFDGEFTRGYF